ncbi:hypothetical protein, partial [Fusobacterium ulcerans]
LVELGKRRMVGGQEDMIVGNCGNSSLFRKYKTEERNHDKRK